MSNENYRITAMEEKLAHLEKMCEELSDLANEQGTMIGYLKAKLNVAHSKLEALEQDVHSQSGENDQGLSVSEIAARDKPPHY